MAVPCGNGGNLTALLTSLKRAKARGLINKLPKIIVAQTKSANTLVRWKQSDFTKYAPGTFQDTVATAMNIQNPVSFPRIKKLYPEFKMEFFDVDEANIQDTRALFMSSGANICPQTAVALDGVLQARARKIIKEKDVVVAIGTASGIKFAESGIAYHMGGMQNRFANPPKVVKGTSKISRTFYKRMEGSPWRTLHFAEAKVV